MKKFVVVLILVCVLGFWSNACEEAEEGVDRNNDIIVRNVSEYNLWIMIDGHQKGFCDNDGIARTMWDGIEDGSHVLQAYRDDDYTEYHCQVTTDFLDDGEDFNWYLEEDHEYSGTSEGHC
ncbi:hypothetical protein JXQ70_07070 [bacterium]|nr:hypothetical protein [bacterium]